MLTTTNIICCVVAYLLGSIPSAVWVGKVFYGIDVREYGSGNAGATNTFRVLGKRAGVPVLLMDIGKGYLAVQLATIMNIYFFESHVYFPGTQQFVNFKLALGICALLGHIFPVYVGFRGGKGVATLLGIVSGVYPKAALVCACIFFVVWIISNYISLASIISGFAFPFVIMLVFKSSIPSMNIFAMAISILILITHQKNIERLLKGIESKISPFGKRRNFSIEEEDDS